ncbi:P-aminobenzoate N-oxygenase AurF [Laspinema olomoucense]|uniref:p-aminobenzoate N-oxygenase AurF n=1 Tax=Laspinema olomoucense D3b TaxID=2953688 RepID=A0ABT2NGE5_9CYAN|nr:MULTISPECIES: P-aminobenzoate N-oxygenase AurF [unclassified Laspinema]MCT7971564.1 P-aminobenzoate N-oxygenase AurF [Laspinema sp. D3d]MCT7981586.1 P-aminobenzoate N-oxygenase AurF [Laspinema sp. D3b]
MNNIFNEPKPNILLENEKIYRKLQLNYQRNKQQDQTASIDQAASAFSYPECEQEYWNPEEFSILYGTPLWDQSTPSQRLILNHLYWVAYYSQIISAEIATILFNQTSAAGLYAQEDFRLVCDMLDLESAQERAHIHAFKTISEQVEAALFGKRIFTYPMRGPYTETMVHADTNALKTWWKQLQLRCFGMLSSGNTFLACQYFTVRGVRTLNGKLVQHKLSQYYQNHPNKENAPIPAKISYYHFLDESFHFNSSTLLSHEVVTCLKKPTPFESFVANLGLRGCQKDHAHFSVAINGIFWYDPALYSAIYELLRSPVFGMSDSDAKQMMQDCFTQETEGLHRSYQTHQEARASYQVYLEKVDYAWKSNREMSIMAATSIPHYLATQKKSLSRRFAAPFTHPQRPLLEVALH